MIRVKGEATTSLTQGDPGVFMRQASGAGNRALDAESAEVLAAIRGLV